MYKTVVSPAIRGMGPSRDLQVARTFVEEERRNPIEIPRELKFAARFDVGLRAAELFPAC